MNIVPALHAIEEPNVKIDPLLCDIQERIDSLFCKEMGMRKIGKNWTGVNSQGIGLLNALYALQNNPEDDLVDVIECWYRDRYNG